MIIADKIFLRTLLTLLVIALLPACITEDRGELEQRLDEIMARKGGRIEPLPEIKPYEAYAYQSGKADAKNPFKLFYARQEQKLDEDVAQDDGLTEEMLREIKNRNKQELEQFTLDSLRMVGTLDNEQNQWAIVLDPNGTVHRVKVGNYLGQNIGKIINIYEDKIELREIVQDDRGRWDERQAALVLVEE